MTQPTGGPAFPLSPNGTIINANMGMTLRDYFASQALNGMLSSGYEPAIEKISKALGETPVEALSVAAYGFADAMLKEREKP